MSFFKEEEAYFQYSGVEFLTKDGRSLTCDLTSVPVKGWAKVSTEISHMCYISTLTVPSSVPALNNAGPTIANYCTIMQTSV